MPLSLRVLTRGRSRTAAFEHHVPCPHCGTSAAPWSADVADVEDELSICSSCGRLVAGDGAPFRFCPVCTDLVAEGAPHDRCLPAGPLPGGGGVLDRALSLLDARYGLRGSPTLERYIDSIHAQIDGNEPTAIAVLDRSEPAIAALPGRAVAVTRGLLDVLEDEAQLAFLLAREEALDRSGAVARRFSLGSRAPRGWFARWRHDPDAQLVRALDLSLWIGFGVEGERQADSEALSALVRSDYDPTSAGHALRRLEAATLSSRGARFLLANDRARWLEESAESLGHPRTARLNREVFRRACRN